MARPDDQTVVQPPPGGGPPARPSRWPWLVGLAVLVLGAAALAYAVTGGGGDAEDAEATELSAVPLARVKVPRVVGLDREAAEERLAEAGLDAKVSGDDDGLVERQTPKPGDEIPKGSLVVLVLASEGERTEPATTEEAPATTEETPATTAAATTASKPAAKPKPKPKPKPEPQLPTVPAVTGLDEGSAVAQLEGAGFSASVSHEPVASADEDGVVIAQSPGGGEAAEPGTTVSLVVGTFEPPEETTTTTEG